MFKVQKPSTAGFAPTQYPQNIADLDINNVPVHLAMQAYPFWYAYNRPYPEPINFKADGYEPIEHQTVGLDDLLEGYDELIQYTLDENGNAIPLPADKPRSTWQDRLINKWTRKKVWKLAPRED